MKLKKIAMSTFLLTNLSFASSVTLQNGWNLVGGLSTNDVDLSQMLIAWTYNNGEWKHSKTENYSLEIEPSQGVWFLYNSSQPYSYTIKDETTYAIELDKGWNLVGDINSRYSIYSNEKVGYVFEYKDSNWIINPTELSISNGYWVYTYDSTVLYSSPTQITPPSVGFDLEDMNDKVFISDSDLNSLSIDDKRVALDKIFTALFMGFSKDDFEDILNSNSSLSKIISMIKSSDPSVLESVEKKVANYEYYWRSKIPAKSLARLFHIPFSKEYIDMWVAYKLINSKFFSASLELNTVDETTGVNLIHKLYQDVSLNKPISYTLYNYLNSEEHWRRFRSPEDNSREVLELQLEVFDDSLVPQAAIACQNYSYNQSDKNLVIDFNYNYEPISMLDSTFYSCSEFYSIVSKKSSVKDVFMGYFIDYYFPNLDEIEKNSLKDELLKYSLNTYKSILLAIIFSDKYVFESEKVKSIEELSLNYMKKIDFVPSLKTFWYLSDEATNSGQPLMHYKLGREIVVPYDILNFATVSKYFREDIMMNYKSNTFSEYDSGWDGQFLYSFDWNDKENSIKTIFKHLTQKNISEDEIDALLEVFDEYEVTSEYDKMLMLRVIMDYTSQIPSTYITEKIVK